MAGARQQPATGLVLPTFASAALRGEPLIVHDDGEQTRAFLHVDDAAEALLLVAASEGLRGRPVNLGGSEPIRIIELARLVIDIANSSSQIVNRTSESVFGAGFAATRDRAPDIGLLTSTTGWRPKRSTRRAVSDCLEYLRCNPVEA
jgi:UDP-glucose 4-epimerase